MILLWDAESVDVSGSITADAVLRGTLAPTFTANAVLAAGAPEAEDAPPSGRDEIFAAIRALADAPGAAYLRDPYGRVYHVTLGAPSLRLDELGHGTITLAWTEVEPS